MEDSDRSDLTAVVAGHICLDIIPELSKEVAFEPGRLVEAGPATLMSGGAVANTGQALVHLGIDAQLIGKVGEGLFGKAVREILESSRPGLSDSLVLSPDHNTSYTIVVNLAGKDRMFLHSPGCNAFFGAEDVKDDALAGARWMHFGYPPLMERMYADEGRELCLLFERAKRLGCTTSLDMSLPDVSAKSGAADWKGILSQVLPYVDLFVPSIEEVLFMLDRPTFDVLTGSRLSKLPLDVFRRLAAQAIEMGAKMVAIKAGDRGLYLHCGPSLQGFGRGVPSAQDTWVGRELWAPCFKVEVVGTTGAGDATIAGLICGILRGLDARDAVEAAVAVGACCCERADAASGVRSWAETLDRVRDGWERLDAHVGGQWVSRGGIYVPPSP